VSRPLPLQGEPSYSRSSQSKRKGVEDDDNATDTATRDKGPF
jgi:hypothetical protein